MHEIIDVQTAIHEDICHDLNTRTHQEMR